MGELLTSQQKQRISTLMQKFEDILATDFDEIRNTQPICNHDIDTGGAKPIKKRPYRMNPNVETWVKEEIDKLEQNGIIIRIDNTKSTEFPNGSPWGSPLVVVAKKGEQLRERQP